MEWSERYNDVEKKSLQFCVQGSFAFAGDKRGHTDMRWETLDQLVACTTREDFEQLTSNYIKTLQKTFKRDAKRFKPAAEWDE